MAGFDVPMTDVLGGSWAGPVAAALAGVGCALILAAVVRHRCSRYRQMRPRDGRAAGLSARLRAAVVGAVRGAEAGFRTGWEAGRAVGAAVGWVLEVLLTILIEAAEEVFGHGRRWSMPPPVFRLLLGLQGGVIGATAGLVVGLVGGLLMGLLRRPGRRRPRVHGYQSRFPDYPLR